MLLNFADFLPYSDTFIETGTCYGRSVQAAIDCGYKRIKSVEANPVFVAETCKTMFKVPFEIEELEAPSFVLCTHKSHAEISFYLGKSVDCLPEMLIGVDKPAVFWLDAHVSGEASAGYQDWLKHGPASDYHQDTALRKELAIILAHRTDHVILIDDQNGPNEDNWRYMQTLLAANPSYRFVFRDEQAGDIFYENKVLCAIPKP